MQRLAGNQQEARAFNGSGHLHLVAIAEHHQVVVAQIRVALQVKIVLAGGFIIEGILICAEAGAAFKNVGEHGVAGRGGVIVCRVCRLGDIQVFRFDDDILHRAARRAPAAHQRLDTPFSSVTSGISCFSRPVTRSIISACGQVGPQLRAVHAPRRAKFGHFLMDGCRCRRSSTAHCRGRSRPCCPCCRRVPLHRGNVG